MMNSKNSKLMNIITSKAPLERPIKVQLLAAWANIDSMNHQDVDEPNVWKQTGTKKMKAH